MKSALGTIALLLLVILLGGAVLHMLPGHLTSSGYSTLLAGQALRIQNSTGTQITVESQYPVSIVGNGCWATRTAFQSLNCGPGDIIVRDIRPRLLIWAQGNYVKWSARLAFVDTQQQAPVAEITHDSDGSSANATPKQSIPANLQNRQVEPGQSFPGNLNEAGHIQRTVRMVAGQTLHFTNSRYSLLRFHSDAPFSVHDGSCQSDYSFNVFCSGSPTDFTVVDARAATASGYNEVTIDGWINQGLGQNP